MSNGCVLEVCVDSLESALEAQRGGAHRIELCSSLIEGGVTPSHGLLQATCRALTTCKVYALIRPRPGDFLYSDVCECQVIQQDLVHAVSVGAQGIVLGMLTADARIDCDRVRGVVDMCRALGVDFTFHRAFDVVRDQRQALEDLIACGVPRVLTSGGAPTALEGLQQISALLEQANGRIAVMPGGGLSESNVETLVRVSGAREVHGTFRMKVVSGMRYLHPGVAFGPGRGEGASGDGWGRWRTDGDLVEAVKQRLKAATDQSDMGS